MSRQARPSHMATTTCKLPAYWCFISYRHVDNQENGRQWATWLHHALETYEVPEDLVGTTNERGETIPPMMFPVFRDEEELSTGILTQRVYEALDRAKVLVVLCSPRAVSSEYVESEILHFKTKRHEVASLRATHAAIIDGDPSSHSPELMCFPDALRYEVKNGVCNRRRPVTPLAADFRLPNGSQGWTSPEAYRNWLREHVPGLGVSQADQLVAQYRARLESALLRLISGVLGVPYAELTKRDKAHQLKKARLIAASQSTHLARALEDKDPIGALKYALEALDVLERDDPEGVTDAYERIAPVVGSGRLARIGENVQQIHLTEDGKALLVVHADGPVEIIRTSDLASKASFKNVSEVSDPWGPNSIWRTLAVSTGHVLVDMRTGKRGLQPVSELHTIVQPPNNEYWKPLASYNHPRAECSTGFAECYITSISDDDEWGAVDSFVDVLEFRTAKVSRTDDIYDFYSNDPSGSPCILAKGNSGWFLRTLTCTVKLGNSYQIKAHAFSSGGRYVAVRHEKVFEVYSCGTGERLFTTDNVGQQAAFSADERFLLLVNETCCCMVSMPDFESVAALEDDFRDVEDVKTLEPPSAWSLVKKHSSEIIVYSHGALFRRIESVDPSGRIAKIKGPASEFVVFSTAASRSIPSIGHLFSLDPEAAFFVTLHRTSDTEEGTPGKIDEVVLRRIGHPNDVIHTIKRALPGYGESRLTVQQSRQYLFVSSYAKEDSIDPPLRSRYEHETFVFGARTGAKIATLPFVVESHWLSQDPSATSDGATWIDRRSERPLCHPRQRAPTSNLALCVG